MFLSHPPMGKKEGRTWRNIAVSMKARWRPHYGGQSSGLNLSYYGEYCRRGSTPSSQPPTPSYVQSFFPSKK